MGCILLAASTTTGTFAAFALVLAFAFALARHGHTPGKLARHLADMPIPLSLASA